MRRFLNRVETNIFDPNDCWRWRGYLDPQGYGQFTIAKKTLRAHGAALFLFFNRRMRLGECVDHLCRTRKCVNPRHLDICSYVENCRRGNAYNWRSKKSYCGNGHLYESGSYRVTARGSRECKVCQKLWVRERRLDPVFLANFYEKRRKGLASKKSN